MGYIKHHAIIVTSWNPEKLTEVHAQAIEVFGPCVSNIIRSSTNIHDSFLIGPDGSSEEWSESEEGDQKRFEFITYLNNHCYVDGSSMISFVEVSYNDDKSTPKILNYSE